MTSLWSRGGLTWKELGLRLWRQIWEDELLGRCAELAYFFLFSIFPLLLFLTTLIGTLAEANPALKLDLTVFLIRISPSPQISNLLTTTLQEVTQGSTGTKLWLSLVTAVCALFETDGNGAQVTVASAGHPLPLRRRPGAVPDPLGNHGVLLGVEGEDDWTDVTVSLAPGDTVLFYTDGVTETPGEATRYGELRLQDAMSRAGDGPVALLAEIERSLREFQSGTAIDDRAMLALRFLGVRAAVA